MSGQCTRERKSKDMNYKVQRVQKILIGDSFRTHSNDAFTVGMRQASFPTCPRKKKAVPLLSWVWCRLTRMLPARTHAPWLRGRWVHSAGKTGSQ